METGNLPRREPCVKKNNNPPGAAAPGGLALGNETRSPPPRRFRLRAGDLRVRRADVDEPFRTTVRQVSEFVDQRWRGWEPDVQRPAAPRLSDIFRLPARKADGGRHAAPPFTHLPPAPPPPHP